MTYYACPNCSAKSRFNRIDQIATPIKLDVQTGDVQELTQLDPFHLPYNGPTIRIQCATCGLIEDELRFLKMAESSRG